MPVEACEFGPDPGGFASVAADSARLESGSRGGNEYPPGSGAGLAGSQ